MNMALNVVASTNLAWQERKAEPFVMTPLACGNPFVNFIPTRFYGGPRDGVTLGTAMAIYGAAVSPNQGYHSSPIIGLLLSLFNVRLGWWLGNPRTGPKIYRREGPLLSIRPALDELAYLLRADPRVATVSTASDVADAFRVLRDSDVDAVFLDIRMPGYPAYLAAMQGVVRRSAENSRLFVMLGQVVFDLGTCVVIA